MRSRLRRTLVMMLTASMVAGSAAPVNAAQDIISAEEGLTDMTGYNIVSEDLIDDSITTEVLTDDNIVTENLTDDNIAIESLTDDDDNAEDPDGYVYYPKDQYDLIFTAYNNGEIRTYNYKIPSTVSECKVGDFLKTIGKYDEVFPSMGGFLDTASGDELLGWSVTCDGVEEYMYGEETGPDSYLIYPGSDYHFTAYVCRKISDNLYVYITPKAIYNGRAHVNYGQKSSSSTVNDVDIAVIAYEDNVAGTRHYNLTYGTDYTVSFKNNLEPSMKMNEDGSYTKAYSNDSKRPYAEIVGKGNFAGYTARAYFDIMPFNLSSDWPRTLLEGLKKSYGLKDGKIKDKIDPKAYMTWNYWAGNKDVDKKVILKNGVDYKVKLYRYEAGTNTWSLTSYTDPNQITQTGDYLYTVWGTGRYCGVAFDSTWEGEFCDGSSGTITPEHYDYNSSASPDTASFQFRVANDVYRDLANASVSVKKGSIKFDGKNHTAQDFGIMVSVGSGSDKRYLTEGTDYTVIFDGDDFPYITSRSNVSGVGYIYSSSICNAVYESKIGIANKYKITVKAVEGSGYYGQKTDKTVTIKGTALSTSGFKKIKPLAFTGQNQLVGPSVSRRGKKKGLTYMGLDRLEYDSNGKCKYLDNINADPGYYTEKSYGFATNYYNAAPGTYYTTLYPIGGGVTHAKALRLPFTRKKISLKDAVKKGYISLNIEPGEYNAGGAMPGTVTVTFLGKTGSGQKVQYNGDYISSGYVNGISSGFIVKASNNKKAGDYAVLTLGSSSILTGNYGFKYSIKPRKITQDTIPVLNAGSWYHDQGKIVPEVLSDKYYTEGQLVAVIAASKKKSGTMKPSLKLYQTYYKVPKDMGEGRLSLAVLSDTQYVLETKEENGACSFKVNFSGTPVTTGFEEKVLNVEGTYSEYDEAAKITGATVVYKGKTLNFSAKSKIELPYEGRQIRFDRESDADKGVVSVTLSDGTVLSKDDFYVEYGDNIAAKSNGGSFKVILKHNASTGTFKYGGSAVFKFTITPADKVNL